MPFFRPRKTVPEENEAAAAARRLGIEGEKRAARYLTKQGYKVLLRNVKLGRGEIDLICRDGDCLVFVEVKTRTENQWSRPADALTRSKRRKVIHAALLYIRELDYPNLRYRFDVVEVTVYPSGRWDLHLIPNAFVTH